MSLLLPVEKRAELKGAMQVDIHGQEYLDVVFSLEDEPGVNRRARLGSTDVEGSPRPGDAVLIKFVMGVATRMKPAS